MHVAASYKTIVEYVRTRLSEERFQHSLRVADKAANMGERYGLDSQRLRLAGLLHDIAKSLSDHELIEIAERYDLICHESERLVPDLLHAPVAAVLAREELGVRDDEVLLAMAGHTLGRPGMSDFEKIIFLADMIEPGRSYTGMQELVNLADRDLDAAMLSGLNDTIAYCLKRGRILHTRTVDTRNYFLKIVSARNKEG